MSRSKGFKARSMRAAAQILSLRAAAQSASTGKGIRFSGLQTLTIFCARCSMEPFGWLRSQGARSLDSESTGPASAAPSTAARGADSAGASVQHASAVPGPPSTAARPSGLGLAEADGTVDSAASSGADHQAGGAAAAADGQRGGGGRRRVAKGARGTAAPARGVAAGGMQRQATRCAAQRGAKRGAGAEAGAPASRRPPRAPVQTLVGSGGSGGGGGDSAPLRRVPGRLQPWPCAVCTFENPVRPHRPLLPRRMLPLGDTPCVRLYKQAVKAHTGNHKPFALPPVQHHQSVLLTGSAYTLYFSSPAGLRPRPAQRRCKLYVHFVDSIHCGCPPSVSTP